MDPISRDTVVRLIDELQEGRRRRVHLRLELEDGRVRWSDFPRDAAARPALPFGQASDSRVPLPDGRALHLHWYERYVQAHIDKVSARQDPIGHVVEDTWLPKGAIVGAIAGAVLTFNPFGALAGALLGSAVAGSAQTLLYQVWTVGEWDAEARRYAVVPVPEEALDG